MVLIFVSYHRGRGGVCVAVPGGYPDCKIKLDKRCAVLYSSGRYK